MAITLKQAKDFRKIIEKYNSGISDDDVVAAPFVLKAWDGNGVDYAVGDRVRHFKFGAGTVTALVREPRDYKVSVDFDAHGQKVMYASFAKLVKE